MSRAPHLSNKGRKSKSSYHIVMIPEDSSQIHRVRLRPWQFRMLIVALVGLVLGLAVTGGGYLRYQRLYHKTGLMRSQFAALQQKQARLAQRLIQLEDTVKRAENVVAKVDLLVRPQQANRVQGVGPLERREIEPVGDVQKFADLSQMESGSFSRQFSNMVSNLLDRSIDLEQEVTLLYQGYQDRMVRLSSTPEIWPVSGWTTSGFGMRRHPIRGRHRFHEGLDIAAPWGTSVLAVANGVVKYAAYKGGYGKTIVIDHGYGLMTHYSHNSKLYVKVGDKVTRGMKIAAVGNTGHSTGAHLHYEVHVDGIAVDPMNFLPPRTVGALAAIAKARAARQ